MLVCSKVEQYTRCVGVGVSVCARIHAHCMSGMPGYSLHTPQEAE